MEDVGTYKKTFEPTIDTLADILEQRDNVYQEYLDSGEGAVTEFHSDRGATNLKKNPRLTVWSDLNTQALSFWRDLGLTPAGLKRIDETSMKKKKTSALAEAMRSFG